MEKSVNSFILNRKLFRKLKITDSVCAKMEENGIVVSIFGSWMPWFQKRNRQIKKIEVTAKNILILNLNHPYAYGHIYSEVFSELCAVNRTYPGYDCILTTQTPLMKKIINFFNLKLSNKIRFIDSDSDEQFLLSFKKLEVVNHSPRTYVNKPRNVANLKSIFHKLKPIKNTPRNFLLFCSRRSSTAAHGRNITQENENEIIEYLKQYSNQKNLEFYLLTGEEPDGSTVSIEKQYELFTNAEIVVGLHGGAMNNLIFLDPAKKPKVIEFCPCVSKNFSTLFDGAIDVFAEYHKIPYILPAEIENQISMLQYVDSSIDISELKKILENTK